MKKNRLKRILAITLSAAMIVTGMSIPVFAEEDDIVEDFVETEKDSNGEAAHTIWIVGDSTVCSYEKTEGDISTHSVKTNYYPKYGYGTQIKNYIDTDYYKIENIALSGRSSSTFTKEKNYTDKLVKEIKADDILIIGFGHNDEKHESEKDERYTDPTGDYKTEGSFAYSIYENYVKLANDVGASAIVCSPIVRRGTNTDPTTGNTVLKDSEKHITAKAVVGNTVYNGGDYSAALKLMTQATNTPFVDLTEITRAYYESVDPKTTVYLHAWATEGMSTVDNTHINIYGAKWVAYNLIQAVKSTNSPLKEHLNSEAIAPVKETDLTPSPYYEPVIYNVPDTTSKRWKTYVSPTGVKFYGTIFGMQGNTDSKYYTFETTSDGSARIAVTENKGGKIASDIDSFNMYYIRIPSDTEFVFTATATVNSLGSGDPNDKQAAFGITARDDMYIDTNKLSVASDYVVAGSLGGSLMCNCFKRIGSVLETGEKISIETGKAYPLSITKNIDGYVVQFGDNAPISGGYDYQLKSVDAENQYLGMFVTRCADVTFSDVKLKVKNKAGDMVEAGSEADDVSGLVKEAVDNGDGSKDDKQENTENAEFAAAEGKGDVKDTAKVTVSANAKGKKEYSIDAVSLAKDGNAVMSITLAKGSKVKLTGYDKKGGSTLEISATDKKLVGVNGKGYLSAKKPTAEGTPALVKYTITGETGTINVALSVTVVEPVVEKVSVSGNVITDPKAMKKLTATVPAGGKDIDVVISMPLNFKVSGSDNGDAAWSKLVIKNKQVLSDDIKIAVDNKDAKVHITAKESLKKGSVSVPFMINGKKFTAKIKVK